MPRLAGGLGDLPALDGEVPFPGSVFGVRVLGAQQGLGVPEQEVPRAEEPPRGAIKKEEKHSLGCLVEAGNEPDREADFAVD